MNAAEIFNKWKHVMHHVVRSGAMYRVSETLAMTEERDTSLHYELHLLFISAIFIISAVPRGGAGAAYLKKSVLLTSCL